MSVLTDGQFLRSSTPWQDTPPSSANTGGMSALTYRGWVLVDVHSWRYAVNDKTGERIRVCRERATTADAMHAFRDAVDARENERGEADRHT